MPVNRPLRVLVHSGGNSSVILHNRDTGGLLIFSPDNSVRTSTVEKEGGIDGWLALGKDHYACMGLFRLRGEVEATYLVMVSALQSIGRITTKSEICSVSAVEFIPVTSDAPEKNPVVTSLTNLLSKGSFYVTCGVTATEMARSTGVLPDPETGPRGYDLTVRWQGQKDGHRDVRFFWNRLLMRELSERKVNAAEWATVCMRGSVELKTVYVEAQQARAALISRMSCERAGARFFTRGVDDSGNVANFVETEQLLLFRDVAVSHVQIRGSAPLFWEQPGFQVGSHKVRLSRGDEATLPAFVRHFKDLQTRYGPTVATSLLSRKEGEHLLNMKYEKQAESSGTTLVKFDFHAQTKSTKSADVAGEFVQTTLAAAMIKHGFCLCVGGDVASQSGVIRTNCLDCLDRTNTLQSIIGEKSLEAMLGAIQHLHPVLSKAKAIQVVTQFNTMWTANGNNLSKAMTGTATISSGGAVAAASRSASRTIKNNFYDGSRQKAIDALLGTDMDVVDGEEFDYHTGEVKAVEDVNVTMPINVAVGTWNVNGGKYLTKETPVDEWLITPLNGRPVDVFAIGFQEIVDLNVKEMVATSAKARKEWSLLLTKVVNSRDDGETYALVTSEQLVGCCIYVFVNEKHLHAIKDVCVDIVKTGVGGKVGNKGATAIRFRMYSTSLCFICAHLPAGQGKACERNDDYHDITRKLDFGKGRTVDNHDYVIWFGDFNYRVDHDIDEIKRLIAEGQLTKLVEFDQLTRERDAGTVFQGFNEGPLQFVPTYKYDIMLDQWDSSEKQRAPAWTDRVLFRGPEPDSVQVLKYTRNDSMKISDHRAVIAVLRFQIGGGLRSPSITPSPSQSDLNIDVTTASAPAPSPTKGLRQSPTKPPPPTATAPVKPPAPAPSASGPLAPPRKNVSPKPPGSTSPRPGRPPPPSSAASTAAPAPGKKLSPRPTRPARIPKPFERPARPKSMPPTDAAVGNSGGDSGSELQVAQPSPDAPPDASLEQHSSSVEDNDTGTEAAQVPTDTIAPEAPATDPVNEATPVAAPVAAPVVDAYGTDDSEPEENVPSQ